MPDQQLSAQHLKTSIKSVFTDSVSTPVGSQFKASPSMGEPDQGYQFSPKQSSRLPSRTGFWKQAMAGVAGLAVIAAVGIGGVLFNNQLNTTSTDTRSQASADALPQLVVATSENSDGTVSNVLSFDGSSVPVDTVLTQFEATLMVTTSDLRNEKPVESPALEDEQVLGVSDEAVLEEPRQVTQGPDFSQAVNTRTQEEVTGRPAVERDQQKRDQTVLFSEAGITMIGTSELFDMKANARAISPTQFEVVVTGRVVSPYDQAVQAVLHSQEEIIQVSGARGQKLITAVRSQVYRGFLPGAPGVEVILGQESFDDVIRPLPSPESPSDEVEPSKFVCGNNVCEPGENETEVCPECPPNVRFCPAVACQIMPGSCPQDCQGQDASPEPNPSVKPVPTIQPCTPIPNGCVRNGQLVCRIAEPINGWCPIEAFGQAQ